MGINRILAVTDDDWFIELESLDLYPLSLICQGSISVQFGLVVF